MQLVWMSLYVQRVSKKIRHLCYLSWWSSCNLCQISAHKPPWSVYLPIARLRQAENKLRFASNGPLKLFLSSASPFESSKSCFSHVNGSVSYQMWSFLCSQLMLPKLKSSFILGLRFVISKKFANMSIPKLRKGRFLFSFFCSKIFLSSSCCKIR